MSKSEKCTKHFILSEIAHRIQRIKALLFVYCVYLEFTNLYNIYKQLKCSLVIILYYRYNYIFVKSRPPAPILTSKLFYSYLGQKFYSFFSRCSLFFKKAIDSQPVYTFNCSVVASIPAITPINLFVNLQTFL